MCTVQAFHRLAASREEVGGAQARLDGVLEEAGLRIAGTDVDEAIREYCPELNC